MNVINNNIEYILKQIQTIIEKKQITKKELATLCQTTPPTLSKILNGTSSMSLEMYLSLCQALCIDPSELLSINAQSQINQLSKLVDNVKKESSISTDTDSLLYDPSRRPFRGILNSRDNKSDCYYVYLKPTISNEKTKILRGNLRLFPSIENPGMCRAEFLLDTGKVGYDKKKITKFYEGQMIISLPMGCCYIVLYSEEHAEINLMIFKHMFLNAAELQCRIAAVATVSAGSNKRPVMEKAILSRTNLDDTISDLEGQLFMTTSVLSFHKDLFDQLSKDLEFFEGEDAEIAQKKQHLIELAGPTIPCYEIEEGKIRSSAVFSASEKTKLINYLKKHSNAPYYCKASSHADEQLYDSILDAYDIL